MISGKFDSLGLAEGPVPRILGGIKELRLTVHSETDNWAILSEVSNTQPIQYFEYFFFFRKVVEILYTVIYWLVFFIVGSR